MDTVLLTVLISGPGYCLLTFHDLYIQHRMFLSSGLDTVSYCDRDVISQSGYCMIILIRIKLGGLQIGIYVPFWDIAHLAWKLTAELMAFHSAVGSTMQLARIQNNVSLHTNTMIGLLKM